MFIFKVTTASISKQDIILIKHLKIKKTIIFIYLSHR
jgi:hypothetical protein